MKTKLTEPSNTSYFLIKTFQLPDSGRSFGSCYGSSNSIAKYKSNYTANAAYNSSKYSSSSSGYGKNYGASSYDYNGNISGYNSNPRSSLSSLNTPSEKKYSSVSESIYSKKYCTANSNSSNITSSNRFQSSGSSYNKYSNSSSSGGYGRGSSSYTSNYGTTYKSKSTSLSPTPLSPSSPVPLMSSVSPSFSNNIHVSPKTEEANSCTKISYSSLSKNNNENDPSDKKLSVKILSDESSESYDESEDKKHKLIKKRILTSRATSPLEVDNDDCSPFLDKEKYKNRSVLQYQRNI